MVRTRSRPLGVPKIEGRNRREQKDDHTMNQQEQTHQQPHQSKKTSHCAQCKCKLGGVKYECKCKKTFCVNHLSASAHTCTFDYRTEGLQELAKQLDTAGLGNKMTKI